MNELAKLRELEDRLRSEENLAYPAIDTVIAVRQILDELDMLRYHQDLETSDPWFEPRGYRD